MVTILMISAKKAIVALLEIKVFGKNVYDAIISVVKNKILLRYSNYIVDVVM